MSRIYDSFAGRAICVFLVLLLAAFMVLHGSPVRVQREAKAEGLGWSVLITFIVELCGGFYDVGLDKLCEYLSKEDPNYETQIAQIKQLLGEINIEIQDIKQALQDIGGVIDQMESYEQSLKIKDILTEIETSWESFEDNVWNNPDPQVDAFCRSVMGSYALETKVRTIYNYISHKNEPRSALDKYTDLLIGPAATVGGTQDFSTRVSTTDGSKVVVERPTYFDYKGWTGGHDVMGAASPARNFYFAEGTSRPGFDTYFCIQNPSVNRADVELTYMMPGGQTRSQYIRVPGLSRATVSPVDTLGPGLDFSTRVRVTNGVDVVAERPMYFNYQGAWTGGHSIVGATSPSTELYFAEGTCRPGFDSYLCVQNPGSSATKVNVKFMMGDGAQKEKSFDMPARSRYTLRAEDVLGRGDGAAYDFSARVASTDGGKIIAERPVYFDYKGWTGGHDVMGTASPAKSFYFAEGTCRPGFDPYLCLQNPSDLDSKATLTYMRGDGTTTDQAVAIPARSRITVSPKDILGSADDAAHDFSIKVVSTEGGSIIAERPMYFNYKSNWTGGHNVMGATAPRSDWYFAEGTVRRGFAPYFCIQNPGSAASRVKMTFMGTDGRSWAKDVTVPAHSRKTILASEAVSSLGNNYCGLEEYFAKLIHAQLCAADMVLEAKNYDPEDYGTADEYVKNSLEPMIREEIDCFRDNAQRLVMAQATLVNDPNSNAISLGQDGAAVLDRANFVCEMLANKALNDKTSKLMGSVISTQDVIPAGQAYELKAYNKTTGTMEAASRTTIVPQYSTSMSEPYNATNWKGPGLVDQYYDQWDGAGKTVVPNNDFSIINYEFSNVTAGYYYDIKDTTGKVVAPNVPVMKYTDDYIASDTGDNTFGSFTTVMRGNAGGKLMMSNWTDKVTNDGSGCGKGADYNITNLTPKHISATMYMDKDESDYEVYGATRQFTYNGPDQRNVKIMVDYSTDGEPTFQASNCAGLHIHNCAAGDYADGKYSWRLYDVTAAAENKLLENSWHLSGGSGNPSASVVDSWTNYSASGQIPFNVKLTQGHTYEMRAYDYLAGHAIASARSEGSIDIKINNLYLIF
jgi:hypothetical protein